MVNKKISNKKVTLAPKKTVLKQSGATTLQAAVTEPKKALRVGVRAPLFTLPSTDGGKVSLASLKGKRVVLYFYPKDMTSGCTVEAREFSAIAKSFAKQDTLVFGISPDSLESHKKFIAKEGITFPLLSDPDHAVAEQYGVWVEKSMYGKKYMGIERSTFVVDPQGKLSAVYRKVKPEGHAECVLSDLSA